ncbi:hypothetical protein L0F51_00295 [Afifella sp. H1R]|uniref:hypothetical protein n=1 Tax=Afifella sp. H1R TaxID=2908841 RepID=UPI001F3E66FB|nr:hypothetical protein [Afifella sp. H1R]MCF1502204.1 hypothetical protein [Afifella sp. H1R]
MVVSRIGLALASPAAGAPHDLYLLPDGNLAVVRDAEAVGQHARQRTMAFAEEWFLDSDVGMPWFDDILGGPSDLPLAEALIKAEIMDTDGVTGIEDFSIRYLRGTRGVDVTRAVIGTEYDEVASV